MVKIDLITGFLGAGKTTFLKKYAQSLVDSGLNIGILENDLGAVNVDMMLLQDIMGDRCELEMIAGGCDADCHKRRFKTKLISMGMSGYDRVIVEPSGIYDVDEFFDTLQEEPLDRWYEIGSVIVIVDAELEEDLSEEAKYLLASQIAGAGKIVFSKVQNVTENQLRATIERLNTYLEMFGCKRRIDDSVMIIPWDELSVKDFVGIAESSKWLPEYYVNRRMGFESKFESFYYLDMGLDEDALQNAVSQILSRNECGRVFRIKGFGRKSDGMWYELNGVGESIHIQPIAQGQDVVIVIGEDLNEKEIRNCFVSFGADPMKIVGME